MRLHSSSRAATAVAGLASRTILPAMPSTVAKSSRRAAAAASTVMGAKDTREPIGSRPSAGKSAEMTVAIFG